jgi:RDD family protein
MTPSSRQAPTHPSEPDLVREFELNVVRRADVRKPAEFGSPHVELPPEHGKKGDPRYPSTSDLRHLVAILIDLVLHLGIAVVVFFVLAQRQEAGTSLLVGIGVFFGLSILDRIVVQRICHATVGKLITGVCLIRSDTGGPPTVWSLVKEWFRSIFTALSLLNS